MKTMSIDFPTRLATLVCCALMLAGLLTGQAVAAGTAPGVGLLVNNYWGQPMTLNIAFKQYQVPAYGQLFIALPAGTYDLSANVNGRDDSSEDDTIVIPAGKAIQMSYSTYKTVFEVVSVAQAAAAAVTQAAPGGAPNTDPNKAIRPDTLWHEIAADQSLWYRFDLFTHEERASWLSIPNSAHTGIRYEVYSSDEISDWWRETPVGIGNLDDDDQVWGVTVNGSSVWYVRVINTNTHGAGFQFTYDMPFVTP
jgi:hypothetical protein